MSLASHNYRNGGWKAVPELYCSSGEAIPLMFGGGKFHFTIAIQSLQQMYTVPNHNDT